MSEVEYVNVFCSFFSHLKISFSSNCLGFSLNIFLLCVFTPDQDDVNLNKPTQAFSFENNLTINGHRL